MIQRENTSRKRGTRFHFKTVFLFMVDMLLVFFAHVAAYYFFKYFSDFDHASLTEFVFVSLFVYGLIFTATSFYSRLWRYASEKDLAVMINAHFAAAIALTGIFVFIGHFNSLFPLLLLGMVLTLFLVSGSRLLIRFRSTWFLQLSRIFSFRHRRPTARALIYGAGSAGSLVSKEIMRGTKTEWEVVGFIDDDSSKSDLRIDGKPIFGDKSLLRDVILHHRVDQLLISRPKLRELVDELSSFRLPIFILPAMAIYSPVDLFSQVRKIQVEDLLGRGTMPVNVSVVGEYIRNKVVLITGAGGSIGREISRQVADLQPHKLILLGRGENSIFEVQQELRNRYANLDIEFVIADIREHHDMLLVFQKFHPNVVFHAAAHKHVPLMEANPGAAFVNNVIGTKNLALLAQQFEVERFVFISTDKAVYPTNVMGSSKRIAEMYLQSMAEAGSKTKIIIVRFGNVLGSRNSVVQLFTQQISAGGPVKVTDERMTRYFMTIPEASRLVIESGAIGMSGHVYLLDMGEPVRIMDLAERMIRLSGFEPKVDMDIQIVGMRPGEKLFEELVSKIENVADSGREGIFRVVCPTMALSDLNTHLTRMWALYSKNKNEELGDYMKSVAWWDPAKAFPQLVDANVLEAVTAAHREVAGTR